MSRRRLLPPAGIGEAPARPVLLAQGPNQEVFDLGELVLEGALS